ncbi:hypothetical protein F4778DRAFT_438446 [Xylariomycetidae sp. FL2044]|nr:hypothetical protein F4778DRAFT_438446 [Xylariomycetidae sp. FL2044]
MLSLLLLSLAHCVLDRVGGVDATSTILTFSDPNCTTFIETLTAPDGFPDGLCTKFSNQVTSPYSSFRVDALDPGCDATIYGNDTGDAICSSDVKIFAQQHRCYNSSWVYYSVDSCSVLIPSSTVSTDIPSTVTSTPSPGTPSPTSSSSSSDHINVGAVAGGATAGGVVGLAMIAALAYFLWWKPRSKKRKTPEVAPVSAAEQEEKPFDPTAVEAEGQAVEAPWQIRERHEMDAGNYIVEAPTQPEPVHELRA